MGDEQRKEFHKKEALAHLDAIKSVLIDKDAFFPYNYNALIVWGVIATIMTFVMPSLMKTSVLQGTLFSIFMMGMGFTIEAFLTKRVNEDYDIESCTRKQKFIVSTFTIQTIFAVVMSALLAKYDLIIPLFMLWMFLCGVGDFVVGYVLNIRLFTFAGYLSTGTAILLLMITLFIKDLGSLDSDFFYFVQGVTVALLGVGPVLIAFKLKKEQ